MDDKMYLEWQKNKISREEESKMPSFTSHDEARAYFKDKYGNDFQMIDSREFEDKKIYFYNLILNKEKYLESRDLFSYQSIEIDNNGNVHIIH